MQEISANKILFAKFWWSYTPIVWFPLFKVPTFTYFFLNLFLLCLWKFRGMCLQAKEMTLSLFTWIFLISNNFFVIFWKFYPDFYLLEHLKRTCNVLSKQLDLLFILISFLRLFDSLYQISHLEYHLHLTQEFGVWDFCMMLWSIWALVSRTNLLMFFFAAFFKILISRSNLIYISYEMQTTIVHNTFIGCRSSLLVSFQPAVPEVMHGNHFSGQTGFLCSMSNEWVNNSCHCHPSSKHRNTMGRSRFHSCFWRD